MPKSEIELIDLREVHDEKLLNIIYHDLYIPNFPISEEQEDPTVWKPLLWGSLSNQANPVLHILVAGVYLSQRRDRKVLGAIFAELYKESKCGLLTYLVIRRNYRHRGLGKYLLTQGIEKLKADATSIGGTLKAVFGEINDPGKVTASQDSMNPRERLRIIAKLGARLVPIRYVQPELRPGEGRSDCLLLVVFPINDGTEASIATQTLYAFLHEFYRVQGVENPENDPDLVSIISNIHSDTLELEKLDLNLG